MLRIGWKRSRFCRREDVHISRPKRLSEEIIVLVRGFSRLVYSFSLLLVTVSCNHGTERSFAKNGPVRSTHSVLCDTLDLGR